jgi:hypothetical protein
MSTVSYRTHPNGWLTGPRKWTGRLQVSNWPVRLPSSSLTHCMPQRRRRDARLDWVSAPSNGCVDPQVVSTMQTETKLLRLRTPVTIGSWFGDWVVTWDGGWTRDKLSYIVMVAKIEQPSRTLSLPTPSASPESLMQDYKAGPPVANHRAAASALSWGTVLKAIAAPGALL